MAKRAKPSAASGKPGSQGGRKRQIRTKPSAQKSGAKSLPEPLEPAADTPAAATALFETGMLALQRHDYGQATTVFRRLLAEFPRERALADRARVYLELCDRELAARSLLPQSTEERVTAATAALNNADEGQAERLARMVLAEDPEHDLALYLLATVEVRRGKTDAAMQYLSQAVAISPEAGTQARHDPEFETLHGTELFDELTEPPPPDSTPPRRRSRAER